MIEECSVIEDYVGHDPVGASICYACTIQGTESGECLDRDDFDVFMPFCRDVVRYRACVPRFQELWPNHTIQAKDQWVRDNYNRMVERRMSIENNDTLARRGVNQDGIPGSVKERFTDNDDCQNAYRNFFCWLNFPRCDREDRSLIMCRSVCENYFKACRFSRDMWRCYNPEFYGGQEQEDDSEVDEDGQPIFLRAQFPGQPFRDNQFDSDGNPVDVCTPSIRNGDARIAPTKGTAVAVAIATVWLIQWWA